MPREITSKRPKAASRPRQEREGTAPPDHPYDVFVSHQAGDIELARDLCRHIRDTLGYEAYLDEQDSAPEMDPDTVDARTAERLRKIMRKAASLILVIGPNTAQSRWMPWELGFFDGRQSSQRIGIYLAEGAQLPPQQEYLGIYPKVLHKADVQHFLAEATMDAAALDSVTPDLLERHLHHLQRAPFDYWLSLLQWQFGFLGNLLADHPAQGMADDFQPDDRPEALQANPWLAALRLWQDQLATARLNLWETSRQGRLQPLVLPALDAAAWWPQGLGAPGPAAVTVQHGPHAGH